MSFKQETKLTNTGVTAATTVPMDVLGSPVAVGDVVAGWMGWDLTIAVNLNSVTDNLGNVYAVQSRVDDATNKQSYNQFTGVITVAGTCSITGNLSGSANSRTGQAAVFDSLISSVPDAQNVQFQTAPGAGTDAISSGNASTTVDGDLIWGATEATSTDTGTVSAGTGYTPLNTLGVAEGKMEYKAGSAVGVNAATFTQSDATIRRCSGIIGFKSVSAAGSGLPANKIYQRKNFGAQGLSA